MTQTRFSGAQRLSRVQDPWEIVADLLTRVETLERQVAALSGSGVLPAGFSFTAAPQADGSVVLLLTHGLSTPVPLATIVA